MPLVPPFCQYSRPPWTHAVNLLALLWSYIVKKDGFRALSIFKGLNNQISLSLKNKKSCGVRERGLVMILEDVHSNIYEKERAL